MGAEAPPAPMVETPMTNAEGVIDDKGGGYPILLSAYKIKYLFIYNVGPIILF